MSSQRYSELKELAAEVKELHELNAELLGTLKQLVELGYYSYGTIERELIETAIAKAVRNSQ